MDDAERPNGLPLSCAAPIDRDDYCVILTFKNGTISGPQSGVSYSGGVGGLAGNALDQPATGQLFAPPTQCAERRGIRLLHEA